MKLKKIGHCGGYEMSRKELFGMIKPENAIFEKIKSSSGKKFLVLQGNTQVMGFLMVLQTIIKHSGYKRSEVVAVSSKMSVFAIA